MSTNRLVLLAAALLFLMPARFAVNAREAQAAVRHTYQVIEAQWRLQDSVQTAEARRMARRR